MIFLHIVQGAIPSTKLWNICFSHVNYQGTCGVNPLLLLLSLIPGIRFNFWVGGLVSLVPLLGMFVIMIRMHFLHQSVGSRGRLGMLPILKAKAGIVTEYWKRLLEFVLNLKKPMSLIVLPL